MTPDAVRAASSRVDHSLATLSALAVAANRGGTLAGAVPSLLRILCGAGRWSVGHAHGLDEHGGLTPALNRWWPSAARRFEPFRRATAALTAGEGAIVRRVREVAGPVWVPDLGEAPWYDRREGALAAGLRSTLAFPIQGPGGLLGLVELLGPEVRPPDPDQMELARHAGIVIGQVLEREGGDRRFRSLFDLLPVPIGITTLDGGRFVEANRALQTFFGRPERSIIGSTPEQLGVVVEGWDRAQRVRDLSSGQASLTVELTVVTPAGGERRVVSTISIVPWAGEPHMLSSLADVTESRRIERQVGRTRARVRALTARLLELQEQERTRISRELHDQIGQRLTALKIILDRLDRLASSNGEGGLAAEGAKIAHDILEDVRTLSFDLRPAVLDQLGLPAAIRGYVERNARAAGLRAEVRVDRSVTTLPDTAQTACFRVLQEAMTNVVRHAAAETVRVRLVQSGDETVLVVEDDGRGFDLDRANGVMGLAIMKERAESVGGRVRLRSELGEGTRVEATFSPSDVERRERATAP